MKINPIQWPLLITLVVGQQGQEDPQGSVSSQVSQTQEYQAQWETLFPKVMRKRRGAMQEVSSPPTGCHMSTHTNTQKQ